MANKSIDTLLADIREMLQAVLDGRTHELPEGVRERFAERVASHVERTLTANDRQRPPKTLYMSEVGKPCRRQLWYSVHYKDKGIEKEALLPHNKVKFLYGDMLEELVLLLADAAGHEVTDCQAEVEMELVDGWRIRGRIDAVIDGHLVDVKSASSYGFKKFAQGGLAQDDAFGYLPQLGGYAKELGHERASFVAIDKTTASMCRLECGPEDFPAFDEEWKRKLVNDIESDTPPPRSFGPVPDGKSGNMKLPVNCSYCPFKHECWKDANGGKGIRTFLYSTGPRFLVEVTKEPKVDEIVQRSN